MPALSGEEDAESLMALAKNCRRQLWCCRSFGLAQARILLRVVRCPPPRTGRHIVVEGHESGGRSITPMR